MGRGWVFRILCVLLLSSSAAAARAQFETASVVGTVRDSSGGVVPEADWQNFPTDLDHFLGYFVAHEAHHRGQLCLIAWGKRRLVDRKVLP